MSFFAYVIYSPGSGRYYKGHCENLSSRLKCHNNGKTFSTRPFRPWNLVYFEEFDTRNEAMVREKFLKSAAGRRFLKEKLKYNAGNRGSPPD